MKGPDWQALHTRKQSAALATQEGAWVLKAACSAFLLRHTDQEGSTMKVWFHEVLVYASYQQTYLHQKSGGVLWMAWFRHQDQSA